MTDDPSRQKRSGSDTEASSPQECLDMTRREWLLRLGGTAVLIGFQGAPATGQGEPAVGDAGQLPPGLYAPSPDHMTHALTSDERFHPIPAGSETDFVRPPSGPFQPQFFSPPEFRVVNRLVALILGEPEESSDAGATIAEISEWIDLEVFQSAAVREAALNLSAQHRALAAAFHGGKAVKALETHDPQKIWRDGLAWLSTESSRRWGKAFLDLPEASQIEILKSLDGPEQTDNAGTQFFVLLKRQVAQGFYTSQIGLKELDYKRECLLRRMSRL